MIDLEKYKGLPYRDHGRDMTGVDCWGLVWMVYRDMGVDLPSWSADYGRADNAELLGVRHCFKGWGRLMEGHSLFDVAVFALRGNIHVGLAIDAKGREMLHIINGRNVCIERVDSLLWRNCFQGFYHYDR